MRAGSGGGLTGLVLGVVLVTLIGAAGLAAWQALRRPEFDQPITTAADGTRAQQKVFEALRRRTKADRPATITLTERELNALLARQFAGELPLASPVLRLHGGGMIDVAGHLPLRNVLAEPPFSLVARALPARWLERRVWVRVRAFVRTETAPRRVLRLEVQEFTLGRQRVPVLMMRVLLDPTALAMLRLPLPTSVEGVTIEPGRAVIRTVS